MKAARTSEHRRIVRERVLRLRDADGSLAESNRLEVLDCARRFGSVLHALAAVHLAHDRIDLLLDRPLHGIERAVLGTLLLEDLEQFFRERLAAAAPARPHFRQRHGSAEPLDEVHHQLELALRVRGHAVDRDDDRHAELPHVLDVLLEIRKPALERGEIFGRQRLLVRAALQLERAHRRDQHGRLGIQPTEATLDVEEFVRAEVGAEPRLRDDEVRERQRRPRRQNRVAAMRDVAERSGVNERRPALERLHEVWPDRVGEQQRHGALRLELAGQHRPSHRTGRRPDDDARQPVLEILVARGQRDDRHDLAGRNDDELLLARDAILRAAQTHDHLAERAVVHVDRAVPGDAPRLDVQRVAPLQVIVDQRRQQRVRARDRMEVAREMQIDVLHRQQLRVAAASRAPLHAEHRTKARLAHAEHGVVTQPSQRLRQSHGDRALALARGRGVHRGDEHQAPLHGSARDLERNLRLVLPVQVEIIGTQPDVRGDVGDGPKPRRLRDLYVRGNCRGFHRALAADIGHGPMSAV